MDAQPRPLIGHVHLKQQRAVSQQDLQANLLSVLAVTISAGTAGLTSTAGLQARSIALNLGHSQQVVAQQDGLLPCSLLQQQASYQHLVHRDCRLRTPDAGQETQPGSNSPLQ